MVTAVVGQNGKRVGYLRVSSLDQNEVRQLDGIELNKDLHRQSLGQGHEAAPTPGVP